MVHVTRKIEFSAAHRYHNPAFSAEENRRIFGKCNNPYGHGHNYVVEVTVTGKVDPSTGMIAHLDDLDGYVAREIIEPFDHMYLNKDVEAFRDRVPTTENVCVEIFARLRRFPGAKLVRIRLEETGRNSFEYAGQRDGDEDD